MFTLGCDPEVFVGKQGKFVSAYGLIPGTKVKPHEVEGGSVQVDGVALEFNTKPATNFYQFSTSVSSMMKTLSGMVPEYEILPHTTVKVDLDALPKEAKRIGCSSDFCPYTEAENEPPDEDFNYRSAGGHIHVGGYLRTGDNEYSGSMRMARLLDRYVGLASLVWDTDQIRRGTYGRAGTMRFKPYGLEYRVLSNAWLFRPGANAIIWKGVERAVKAYKEGNDVAHQDFRKIIDNLDLKAALKVIK